jgi:hypothetical protein
VNIDLARHVARAAFRSSRELGELVPFLKDRLNAEEYSIYAKAIGSAVASIQVDLMNKLVADHPGLEAEIEASIGKYGRYL